MSRYEMLIIIATVWLLSAMLTGADSPADSREEVTCQNQS